MAKEMTYSELYKKFCVWSPEHANMVEDYRPWGRNSIVVWLKNGMMYKVKYIDDTTFIMQTVTKVDIDKKFSKGEMQYENS